jgi:hypothetical protein
MNNNNNNNNSMTTTMMNAMKRVERLKTQVVVDSRDDNAGGIPTTSATRLERQETFFSSPWVRFFFLSLFVFLLNGASNRFFSLSLSLFATLSHSLL